MFNSDFSLGHIRSAAFGVLLSVTPILSYATTLETGVGDSYFGDNVEWLMDPSILVTDERSDKVALTEVGRLFQVRDERAPLALQNYMNRFPGDAAAFDLAGVVLMQETNYENAVVSFRKGIELAPSNAWLWAKLGAALALNKKDPQAKQSFERALQLDPDNPLALRHTAQYAVRSGDLITATQASQRALRAFGLPRDTINQAHFDLAELYGRLGRQRDGLELLRPAVENPNLNIPENNKLELYGRYMDMAMGIGDAQAARSAYQKLSVLVDPNDARVKLTEARILRLEGKYIDSLALIAGISAANAQLAPQLLPDQAITLAASGQHAQAALVWRELADLAHDSDPLPYLREAFSAEINAGEVDAVSAEVQALAQDHPDDAEYAMLELVYLGKTGRTDLALERAMASSSAFPNDHEIQEMLGVIAAAQGDTETSRLALERALEIKPDEPQTWLTLAGVTHGHGSYVSSGHSGDGGHDEVENLLQRAIAANPSESDLYAELGLMYLSDGRVEDAIARFNQAVANNPSHMAGLSLGALARADIGEDLDVALAKIQRARLMAPEDDINKDIMGWVLTRQGDTDAGLSLLEEAAAAEPQDVTIQYHLGVAKEMIGEDEQARGHYLSALAGANYNHNVEDTRARYLSLASETSVVVSLSRIDEGSNGASIGTIQIESGAGGIVFTADMAGLDAGQYAAHVHEYANCGATEEGPASLAGSHYGHADHAGHDMAAMAAAGMKPKGDLAPFVFDASGTSSTQFTHAPLTLDEIRGRSVILHIGLDEDGQSGPKVACGIIR